LNNTDQYRAVEGQVPISQKPLVVLPVTTVTSMATHSGPEYTELYLASHAAVTKVGDVAKYTFMLPEGRAYCRRFVSPSVHSTAYHAWDVTLKLQ